MSHDPFAVEDDDRTVLRPRNVTHRQAPPQTQQSAGPSIDAMSIDAIPLLGGINPLEKAASRLITLVMVLRKATNVPNPESLRQQLIREVDTFKQRARDILPESKQAVQASYVMCSFIDEAAMNTPWGSQANWSQHNLLSTFHNEVGGGERFFSLLKKLAENPGQNKQLLEFMYLLLSLGYEGAYRIATDGQQTLVKVRNWLYNVLQSAQDPAPVALSSQWEGSNVKESRLPRSTPLWVTLSAALALGTSTFLFFRVSLLGATNEVVDEFWSLEAEPLTVRTIAAPVTPRIKLNDDTLITDTAANNITLKTLLKNEIAVGDVTVNETFDRGVVRLTGDELFQSGKTALSAAYEPLITQIGLAISQIEGDILVTGHTDNIPIRSARFPSNIELSQARAEAVSNLLQNTLNNDSFVQVEGRGSFEPVASNDTREGRATNRRVEITVFY